MSSHDGIGDDLDRLDKDPCRGIRENLHAQTSQQDPVYISGSLHHSEDVGDVARARSGLHQNSSHGGWDMNDDWYGGGISSARRDTVRENLSDKLEGGQTRSRAGSFSLHDAERVWYQYSPSDGFAGYHQGWHGTGEFSSGSIGRSDRA